MPGNDFICFTDDPTLMSCEWEIRLARPRYAHPRLSAKYFKMLPDVVLPEYDETLWIDASLQLQSSDFADEAFSYLTEHPIAVFSHPERNCIYAEASFCEGITKYRSQDIRAQVEWYERKGYPRGNGLYACGVIARPSDDPTIRSLNRLWLEENETWTYQDQLSFPVIMKKLNIRPGIFRHHLWNNPWFTYVPHDTDL